jgi:hypothetical protein
MSLTEKEIEYTIVTLAKVINHQRKKLVNAATVRQGLSEALARGEMPDHYRIKFIRDSIKRVNALMATLCEEFNTAHPDDRCSAADLCDILYSTIQNYKAVAEAGGK